MRKNYLLLLSIVLFFFVFIYVCIQNFIKKEEIYIKFENIQGYHYHFMGTDSLNPDNILIKQEGQFWYMHWDLEMDKKNVERIDVAKFKQIEYCSQYWIVNNYNGFSMSFDLEEAEKYKIFIVNFNGDDIYLLPVDKIKCIVQ